LRSSGLRAKVGRHRSGEETRMQGKLPVLGLIGAAWRDVLGHLPGLARIAWPYYALALALSLLAATTEPAGANGDGGLSGTIAWALGAGTAGIVLSLCVLACAVRWQRHVVLAEPLVGIAPLNRRVLRYVWRSIVVGLITASPVVAAGLVGHALGAITATPEAAAPFGIDAAGIGLIVLGMAAAVVLLMRLGLAPVGASVDDGSMGLRASWAATRGHDLRLFGTMVLLALGFGLLGAVGALLQALIAAVGAFVAAPAATGAATAAGAVLDALLDLITGMVAASLFAHIYRLLAASGPAPTTAAA
jgi:hypothetical protein